jgi:hypothetical protein
VVRGPGVVDEVVDFVCGQGGEDSGGHSETIAAIEMGG